MTLTLKAILRSAGLAAGIAAGLCAVAVPAQAQSDRNRDACLMSARISGYDAQNDHTLIVTDTSHNRYRVNLSGICNGMSNPRMAISIRSSSRLSCIGLGDRVAFRDSVFGRQSCVVRSVQLLNRDRRDSDRRWDDREGRYR